MSAFLKKNQKKGNKAKAGPATEAAEATGEETKAQDAEVVQSPAAVDTKAKADSSDEEEDELAGLSYGNIKEKKDVAARTQDAKLKAGYGFDEPADPKAGVAAAAGGQAKPKKTASDITFGGARPKFARSMNKGKLGGEFAEGLDDIDGGGASKKTTHAARAENATGEGGREFVNLGASARVGGETRGEEEKQSERPTGVKPTFRGKLNTRGAANDDDEPRRTYGFEVALRTEPRERREDGQGEQVGKTNARPRGQALGAAKDEDEDEGFEVVQGRKPRRRP